MTQTQNEEILLGKWHLGKIIKSKDLINIASVCFLKKSHIHTISAKHSKIKLSRPLHIIEVPKREKKKRIRFNIPRDNG